MKGQQNDQYNKLKITYIRVYNRGYFRTLGIKKRSLKFPKRKKVTCKTAKVRRPSAAL